MNAQSETEIEIHPLAKVYRLYVAEEMEDLVASIKKNGQRDPIMLDEQGRVIDGRNRLQACLELGIEPKFETFIGDEEAIAEYIHDKNSVRRDITTGQRAMAYALLFPNPAKLKRKDEGRSSNGGTSLERGRISEARTILKYAEAEIENVILGTTPFKTAYEKAAQRKREDEPDKPKEKRLTAIRAVNPALADLVQKELKTIEEAERQIVAEAEKAKEIRQRTTGYLYSAMLFLGQDENGEEWAKRRVDDFDSVFFPATEMIELSPASVRRCAESLLALAQLMEKERESNAQANK